MSEIDNVVTLPSPDDIETQAASWLTVLGRADLNESDKADFERWLNSSDRHRAAFNELAALWDDMSVLKELDDIAESAIAVSDSRPRFWQSHPFISIAASIIICVVIMGVFSFPYLSNPEQQDVFITEMGQQRTVELSDGSTLQLNTDSHVEINFSRDQRNIRLISGEVYFDVAKNKRRPFNVYAGGGIVRAVGTAFAVRLLANDDVEVVVEEGRVALNTFENEEISSSETESPPAQQQLLAELTAGQSAVFAKKVETLDQLPAEDMDRVLAWRQGMLSYNGDPLLEVVEDVSRYIDVTIEIPDPALQALPIAGYFKAGEVEALFDSLEFGFGLQVEHLSETHVRLSSLEKELD
jgi:transmembrane sensor